MIVKQLFISYWLFSINCGDSQYFHLNHMQGHKLAGLLEAANKAYAKLLIKAEDLEDDLSFSEALFEMKNSLDQINKLSE